MNRLDEIRRWSRITADMEATAAKACISPLESKNEKRLREHIDFLLSEIDKLRESAEKVCTVIEAVENRCSAADGPVTEALKEITQTELGEVYMASVAICRLGRTK